VQWKASVQLQNAKHHLCLMMTVLRKQTGEAFHAETPTALLSFLTVNKGKKNINNAINAMAETRKHFTILKAITDIVIKNNIFMEIVPMLLVKRVSMLPTEQLQITYHTALLCGMQCKSVKMKNKIVYYEEIAECWHLIFRLESQRRVWCNIAKLEQNRRLTITWAPLYTHQRLSIFNFQ
jgi:hypothetical protein